MNGPHLSDVPGGDGVPVEPDWQSIYSDVLDQASAHEHWGVALRELREAGTLSVANGSMLQRLVEFRVVFARSALHVAEHGAILQPSGKRAKIGQWNPHWSAMRQADERIVGLEDRLGLTPVARGKATKVDRVKKTPRAADAYLRAVAK